MKLTGIKFLAGGVTAASATGLGVGISSIDLKERPKTLSKTKDESKVDSEVSNKPIEEVQQTPSAPSSTPQPPQNGGCKVVKLEKASKQFEEKNWEQLKNEITKVGNETFLDDVEKACKGKKLSYQGKVYVTENGGKWIYSSGDQKEWNRFNKK
ncbi:hypothetical protein MHC_02840 [Mycoplasma haemocanis str. Illinois]|uniref:Uncharacterized protein n=1 Tax=Mycoplasma haemocanis (strain Illinois) TaxID=1111676 RepID=H6N708_MYCHN|nr:hypothetical protein [Mycoplasma haemocanis]AEW45430.1 hypothetical protein MHC_02840 [Mycoplasma haemocanis str. Illinois]